MEQKDPSFKEFLEKLSQQNTNSLTLQSLQVKYEREMAGEDNDKREEQLERIKDNLDGTQENLSSVREGLSNISDDIIEVQDQLDSVIEGQEKLDDVVEGQNKLDDVIEGQKKLEDIAASLEKINESAEHLKELNTFTPIFEKIQETLTGLHEELESSFEDSHLISIISAIGKNQTVLLDESLKELSLIRKLTEGSVEYDKENAKYRNLAGRDVQSIVTGKTAKAGGFIDFETARNTLSGQGERAREANKISLITSVTTTKSKPGNRAARSLGAGTTGSSPVESATQIPSAVEEASPQTPAIEAVPVEQPTVDPTYAEAPAVTEAKKEKTKRERRERVSTKGAKVEPKEKESIEGFGSIVDLGKAVSSRLSGIVEFLTKGTQEKELFGKNTGITDKQPEAMGVVTGTEIPGIADKQPEALDVLTNKTEPTQEETRPGVTGKNPESDNIVDSQEIMADNSKTDLELSKEALEVQKQQLDELLQIRQALAPKTPSELPGGKTASSLTGGASAVEGGGIELPDLPIPPLGRKPSAGAPAGKPGRAPATGGKLGNIAKIGGAALAIGAGAYTAYTGYSAAEDSKQAKLEEVQVKLDAGEITPEQAAVERKEIGNKATVEKSEAVGEGTGLAAGAIGGGLAGAKLGATLGTFVGGPVGTAVGGAIGGLAGGALGAFAGTKAGQYVGEKVGTGINTIKGFFGGDVEEKVKGTVSAKPTETQLSNEATVQSKEALPKQATIQPVPSPITGPVVARTSTENADLARQTSTAPTSVTPIVSSNVNNVNTTSYVPIKPQPRPEQSGSALDRYQSRISAY